jgi:hypothetical protein
MMVEAFASVPIALDCSWFVIAEPGSATIKQRSMG